MTYTTGSTHKATYGTVHTDTLPVYGVLAELESQARDAYHDAQLHDDALIQGIRFEQWMQATEAANRTLARWLATR